MWLRLYSWTWLTQENINENAVCITVMVFIIRGIAINSEAGVIGNTSILYNFFFCGLGVDWMFVDWF